MEDHIEIGHLTKCDAFRLNGDQVMDLEIWFKIHTNVSYFETASRKTLVTLKIFYDFRDTFLKWANSDFYLSFFQIVGA